VHFAGGGNSAGAACLLSHVLFVIDAPLEIYCTRVRRTQTMIFKPATKQLFTDDGTLIKELSCPKNIKWDDLSQADGTANRTCSICQKNIFDTANCTDRQIIDLVRNEPSICLKINPDQENIKIIIQYDYRIQ
jgi:hypothetical protein